MVRQPSSPGAPVTRTFAMTDVARQYRELVAEADAGTGPVHDTLIVGGGAAGAGGPRDPASRGHASAPLGDPGPVGGAHASKTGTARPPGVPCPRPVLHR